MQLCLNDKLNNLSVTNSFSFINEMDACIYKKLTYRPKTTGAYNCFICRSNFVFCSYAHYKVNYYLGLLTYLLIKYIHFYIKFYVIKSILTNTFKFIKRLVS